MLAMAVIVNRGYAHEFWHIISQTAKWLVKSEVMAAILIKIKIF